jgi:DNA polymerase-3 subunit alpha
MKYVSLHHHSTFSYMDGYGMPDAHHARAAELGMTALALTEHGNVSSHVKHEQAGAKYGVKPIYGCELYTAPTGEKTRSKWHLTALAETQEGYQNLNQLVTRAWAEGFYQWPTVSGPMLSEHAAGLILTSGCADSLLACTLMGGKSNGPQRDTITSWDMDNAEKVIRKFQDMMGKDNYFLEVQQFPGLARTRALNPAFAELSVRTGATLVATSDCHYPLPTDNEMQKILHAAGRGTGTVAAAEAGWEYGILLTPPTSDNEIWKNLVGTGLTRDQAVDAIMATAEIAERCNVVLPKNELLRFPLPQGYDTPKDLIWAELRKGWTYRWERNPHMRANKKMYVDKLNYEMSVVEQKEGYLDYFLMVSNAVIFAKDSGIAVGPARGSAAASLILYLLRVTEVDPCQFPTMVFERFIDVARTDMPDIDLDFADDRRDEVRQHLVQIYGHDRVANIGNFVRYRGKNSIVDVARVYTIPKYAADKVKDLIIERSGGDSRINDSLEDTFETFDVAREVLEQYPDLARAIQLEGNMRGMSVHAAGIVISNNPITDTCAMYERTVAGESKAVLAYDKKDAEYLGMLKMDFLGLAEMSMINIALAYIGMTLDELYQVPLTDAETLEGFRETDVVGIFQFKGRATRLICQDVVPDHFMHLADINALARPGPLFSGMTAQYIEVKHGRAEPDHLHPIVWKYTEQTYGQIIYQEQVLGIIREIGGFPVAKIGDIRKIISQKLGEASFNTMKETFVDGAKRLHNIDEGLADRIWKFMVTSATYSFNVAHCISYSMLAFWSMHLKRKYPMAFYAAALRKTAKENWPKLLRDARKKGINVLPPDILNSEYSWSPDPDQSEPAIRAGFVQIPGVGDITARNIIKARDADPMGFQTWEDLIKVPRIGPKTMERIREFCYSDDPFNLDLVGKTLAIYRDSLARGEDDWAGLPVPTHTSDTVPRDGVNVYVTWIGIVNKKEFKDLIEDERARSGDTVEEILQRVQDPELRKSCTLKCYDDGDEDVYLRFNRWNYPDYQEAIESITCDRDIVLIKGVKKGGFGVSLQVRDMIIINPDGDADDVIEGEVEYVEYDG